MTTIVLFTTSTYDSRLERLLVNLHEPTLHVDAIECEKMAKGPTELRVQSMARKINSRNHVIVGRNYLTSREWRAVLSNSETKLPDKLVIITDKTHNFPAEHASAAHDVYIFTYPDYKFIKRRMNNVEIPASS